MSIRELIEKKPVVCVSTILTLACVAAIAAWESTSGASQQFDQSKAFFSDDDGATYFVDSSDRASGFDHNGKPAYAVNVYVGGSGKPFVGFLRQERPVASKAGAGNGVPPAMRSIKPPAGTDTTLKPGPGDMEMVVKKPGESTWRSTSDPKAIAMLRQYGPLAAQAGLHAVVPQ